MLGKIEQRAFNPGPVDVMNPADAEALDEAAFSFRVHAGHRRTWTDGQGVQASLRGVLSGPVRVLDTTLEVIGSI